MPKIDKLNINGNVRTVDVDESVPLRKRCATTST